jgi:hypothetical protein
MGTTTGRMSCAGPNLSQVPTSLTDGQLAVLKAFHDFEPMTDEVLAVWIHHFADLQMSSSGVRTRRAELSRPGKGRGPLIHTVGVKKTRSRHAAVHDLTPEGKRLAKRLFNG